MRKCTSRQPRLLLKLCLKERHPPPRFPLRNYFFCVLINLVVTRRALCLFKGRPPPRERVSHSGCQNNNAHSRDGKLGGHRGSRFTPDGRAQLQDAPIQSFSSLSKCDSESITSLYLTSLPLRRGHNTFSRSLCRRKWNTPPPKKIIIMGHIRQRTEIDWSKE